MIDFGVDTPYGGPYDCPGSSQRAHSAKGDQRTNKLAQISLGNKTMDELDRKIIALLQLDGRASNAKIAREVGVSEGTVRRRLPQVGT
ncbi:MAG: hypothetical protein CM1200mP27_02160 [Chloroflexota bacterium]|nr:MAG: hypothetical protein CM1200mP27_02160 [Chloroflexota bacterium]